MLASDEPESGTGVETHEAIVVGGGAAGLAAAAALKKAHFETLIIETSGAVGARWRSTQLLAPDVQSTGRDRAKARSQSK